MKTKRKGKKKIKEEMKKKQTKKQALPGIELGTFRTPGRFVVTTPCETHSEIFDNILLKAFSLEFIHSFYFAINQKYNNSIQKYIKDNIQYSN